MYSRGALNTRHNSVPPPPLTLAYPHCRFATQAERPFLFPPKFTFVFRAFSTIDGIGKTLTGPRYDLSRISQPYLRELADLRDGSALKSAALELGRRVGWRPQDVAQLVTQPRAVAGVAQTARAAGRRHPPPPQPPTHPPPKPL